MTDLGILEPLLQDPDIMEIMINGYQSVYVDKRGQLLKIEPGFASEEALLRVIEAIATPLGQKLTESTPILDLRLEDASRVHVVGRPIALNGPAVNIRKVYQQGLTVEQLIEFQALTPEMAEFLQAAVENLMTTMVVGSIGSGKTTLLKLLCGWINPQERIITVEQVNDLLLDLPHQVVLETRPPNLEGRGEITMRHLIQAAGKMRPERVIVNPVNGGEAWDLIQVINEGHDGSMFTINASSGRDALNRLEIMMAEANPSMPVLGLREWMGSALDLIVVIERMRDGVRRIKAITEVLGMNNGLIELQDIFIFEERSGSSDGRITGRFTATGRIPRFMTRFPDGRLPLSMFNPAS